jgi:hypothetical protein
MKSRKYIEKLIEGFHAIPSSHANKHLVIIDEKILSTGCWKW